MGAIVNHTQVFNKSKSHSVRSLGTGVFEVVSGGSGKVYQVTLGDKSRCTCPWGRYSKKSEGTACSHVQAVVAFTESQAGYSVTARPSSEDTSHLHRAELDLGQGVKFTLRAA